MGKNRFFELDALRGIAALVVVLYHYTTKYNEIFGHEKASYITPFDFGHYGVQLFFMISGFVIYMSVIKVKSAKDFVIKRMIRLYPAYIFSIILTSLIVSISTLNYLQRPLLDIILNFSMLQGFIPGIEAVDGVYWTLRIEIVFYALMTVLLLLKMSKKTMIFTLSWLIGSVIIQFADRIFDSSIITKIILITLPGYSHLFIIGIMFYLLKDKNEFRFHGMIILCVAYDFIFLTVQSGLFTVLFTGLFYLMIYGKLKLLNNKPLVFLGTISYTLYLVHQFIGYTIIYYMESIGLTNEFFIIVPISIAIILAYLITRFIEKPIQGKLFTVYKSKQTPAKDSHTFPNSNLKEV